MKVFWWEIQISILHNSPFVEYDGHSQTFLRSQSNWAQNFLCNGTNYAYFMLILGISRKFVFVTVHKLREYTIVIVNMHCSQIVEEHGFNLLRSKCHGIKTVKHFQLFARGKRGQRATRLSCLRSFLSFLFYVSYVASNHWHLLNFT